MAGGIWGADLEQMHVLESQFKTHAGNAEQMLQSLSGALDGTAWTGTASDTFRGEWHSTYAPALRGLRDRLQEHATIVNRRAEAVRIATS